MGIEQDFNTCTGLALQHYENFPVASRLLPEKIRTPVAVIYAFARTADDMADEGDASPSERIRQLDDYSLQLDNAINQQHCDSPVLRASAAIIEQFQLPVNLFYDLISAFRQDVETLRYPTFDKLLDYCRRSANPVGRLMLHLQNQATKQNLICSDNICTSLQLINFLQDISQDYTEMSRIYIPQEHQMKFLVGEQHFKEQISDTHMQQLIMHEIDLAYQLMINGKPLGQSLKGLFGLEIRMIIQGGLRVLEKLRQQKGDLFSRPRLSKVDRFSIIFRALLHL